LEDTTGVGWAVRLVVGGAIVALLVLRRRPMQLVLGRLAVAVVERVATPAATDDPEAGRAYLERIADGVVDLLLLLLAYALVGAPIAAGLELVIGPLASVIVVTGVAVLVWLLLTVRLFRAAGLMGVVLGVVLGAPLLLSIPALAQQLFSSSLPATVAAWG